VSNLKTHPLSIAMGVLKEGCRFHLSCLAKSLGGRGSFFSPSKREQRLSQIHSDRWHISSLVFGETNRMEIVVDRISDWGYVVPLREKGVLCSIGFRLGSLPLKIDGSLVSISWADSRRYANSKKEQDNVQLVVADSVHPPFRCGVFDWLSVDTESFSEGPKRSSEVERFLVKNIYPLLKDGGFIFLKSDSDIMTLQDRFHNIRRYFSVPSFENPWFILPVDDPNVVRYFIMNMLSSRFRSRRIVIGSIRLLTLFGLHRLLLHWVHFHVIVAEKGRGKQ